MIFCLFLFLSSDCQTMFQNHLKSDLSLSWQQFDQTMHEGWRELADQRCYREAADLILAYNRHNGKAFPGSEWHLAQLFGFLGDYNEAIKYALKNIFLTDEAPFAKWHSYVLGTVAFWNKDRDQLKRCISVLKKLADDPGSKKNLELLQQLDDNFNSSYEKAYLGKSQE